MKLVFIRHSASLVNPDIPIDSWGLSEEGIVLAQKLHENSNVQKIQIVYASLQPKAIETAIYATKNKGIYIRTDVRLTEITSFTRNFQPLAELEANTQKFYKGEIDRLYDGESKEEALQRFNQAIHEIVAKEYDKDYVGIVSHGAVLSFFFSQYNRKNPLTLLHEIKQPDVAVIDWETKEIQNPFSVYC